MTKTPVWRRYLRFWGPDVKADVDIELAFHLDMRTQELVDRGWSPADARAEALRSFRRPSRHRHCVPSGGRAPGETAARPTVPGRGPPGSDLRAAPVRPDARLCRRRRADAGAGHRRQRRGVHRGAGGAGQTAAVRPPRAVGRGVGSTRRTRGAARIPCHEPESWDLRDSTAFVRPTGRRVGGGGGNLTATGGEPQRVTTLAATTGLLPLARRAAGPRQELSTARGPASQRKSRDCSARVSGGAGWAADPQGPGEVHPDRFGALTLSSEWCPSRFRFPAAGTDIYSAARLGPTASGPHEKSTGLGVVGRLKANATLAGANAELRITRGPDWASSTRSGIRARLRLGT